MSKITHCKRYGCTAEGHPALDGCCSVECRDVFDMTVERDEAIAERDRLKSAIEFALALNNNAYYDSERKRMSMARVLQQAFIGLDPVALSMGQPPPRATVEGKDA